MRHECPHCGGSHGHPQIDADLYAACAMETRQAGFEKAARELVGLQVVGVRRYGDHVDVYFVGKDGETQMVLRRELNGAVVVEPIRQMGPNYTMGAK